MDGSRNLRCRVRRFGEPPGYTPPATTRRAIVAALQYAGHAAPVDANAAGVDEAGNCWMRVDGVPAGSALAYGEKLPDVAVEMGGAPWLVSVQVLPRSAWAARKVASELPAGIRPPARLVCRPV